MCTQLTLVLHRYTHPRMHTHRDCATIKYGGLHPALPEKQSRLFKQQPVKASIQFCSEAHSPLNGPLRLSDNSSLPEKKNTGIRKKKKKKRKGTYFPVQSNPRSIAMAPDIRLFLPLTRRGPPQPLCFFKTIFFLLFCPCVCACVCLNLFPWEGKESLKY